MNSERLIWIENWSRGWKELLEETEFNYSTLALECSVNMTLEVIEALKEKENQ